jgi:restriction system protein
MTVPEMPTYEGLLWPTLEVLKISGGSASIQELSEQVTRLLVLPDEVSDTLHGGGPGTEVDYRLAWARTNLKWLGAVENTARGVWTITPIGRAIPSDERLRDLSRQERKRRVRERVKRPPADRPIVSKSPAERDWREELLAILRGLKPDAFERLCQRILRESGFTKVEVTGRSGDGGIDGAGVLRVNLISFHVRFQCKRYAGSVGASEIRDFRGAMVGRADKGLFLTTGRFTSDAAREAVRDGAPAIDLIDGLALLELLRKLKLGVSTELVESIRPQPEFFAEL